MRIGLSVVKNAHGIDPALFSDDLK